MVCATEEINRTAWGAQLLLTVGLAYPLSCSSFGHLLMAQHCYLHPNDCFLLLSPPYPPIPFYLPTLHR